MEYRRMSRKLNYVNEDERRSGGEQVMGVALWTGHAFHIYDVYDLWK